MPQYANYYQPQNMMPSYQPQYLPQSYVQERFGGLMQNQIPNITGKVVPDFSTITANDVPMDNNGALFVKADGTEIQLRAWQPDGTISTRRFKQVLEDNPINSTPSEEKSFYEDFRQFREDVLERLDKLDKQKTTRTKKEVEENA